MTDPTLFVTATVFAKGPFGGAHDALTVPFIPLVILERPDGPGSVDPLFLFFFSSFLSRVVRARVLPTRRTLSAVEGNYCEIGLTGGAASTLYTIRCGIQAEGILDGGSPCHEEGTGLDANKLSPMYGGSMSWNASEIPISISSKDVVET